MKIGFIGLGNVGGKLAGSLLRNDLNLSVHDLNTSFVADFVALGARDGVSPAMLMQNCDVVITCLPNPAASDTVVTEMLPHVGPGKIWMEMSTTDANEVKRLGALVIEAGGEAVDCPVSGGCHRADTGNISIYAGCKRSTFDKVLPVLTHMGRRILHVGDIGNSSLLKVMTNYLATANLITVCEALTVMKAAGMDMGMTYEAISMSSGTSFVHETEIADDHSVPLEVSPLIIDIMTDGQKRYGERAQSDRIIERLEEATGLSILAEGFPRVLIDEELEERGKEVVVRR